MMDVFLGGFIVLFEPQSGLMGRARLTRFESTCKYTPTFRTVRWPFRVVQRS